MSIAMKRILCAWLCIAASAALAASTENPILLRSGPHLFIDDYLITDQDNLKRSVNHPVRLPQPIVTGKEDKNFQPYLTVLRDAKTGRFRIWYGIPENASQTHLAYMESEDGIHWIRPHRVLTDPARVQFGTSIIDDGADFADPSKRYKWGWWNDGGLNVAASPDGLTWKLLAPGVVLKHNHDISCIFRDPIRNRYIAMVSSYTEGTKWQGKRRVTMQSVSEDLIHWKEPWYVFTPDEKDEGETQFYCMAGLVARGNLLIGLLKVLRDDLPADPGGKVAGIGYTVLGWSRDSEHWQRDREPFLDRNQQPGTWDHAMTWGDCQLIVGNETYIYYGGYARGHKIERFTERQIGLARMPIDRYVAREAGATTATLTTPLVLLDGESMTINAKVDGEIKVRILDPTGKPWPLFDYSNCKPIRGDSVRHQVQWGDLLASLRHKPVRLQFEFRKASLYGFDLLSRSFASVASR